MHQGRGETAVVKEKRGSNVLNIMCNRGHMSYERRRYTVASEIIKPKIRRG